MMVWPIKDVSENLSMLSAQSLRTQPGMLSGPGSLCALMWQRGVFTLGGDRAWSMEEGVISSAGILLAASKCLKSLAVVRSQPLFLAGTDGFGFNYIIYTFGLCVLLEVKVGMIC